MSILLGLFVLAMAFTFFVAVYDRLQHEKNRHEIQRHVTVLSDALWHRDATRGQEYLNLAVSLGHQDQITVKEKGEVFLRAQGDPSHWADRTLMAIGLIQIHRNVTPLSQDDVLIGELITDYHNGTASAYVYALVVVGLLFVTYLLFLRVLDAKSELTVRVADRTYQLVQVNIALQEYKTAVEQSVDGIVLASMDGEIRFANEAWARMHGCSAAEVTGRPMNDFHSPEQMEDVNAFNRRLVETGSNEGELKHVRKNGQEFPSMITTTVLKGENRKPFALLAIMRDITDHNRAEDERRKLQEQLTQAQKMESIGRLAGGVAHDFNNMLSVILGNTELALDGLPEDSPLYKCLAEIRKSTDRSANLTRQLLAYARKQPVAPKTIDLNESIAAILQMLERLIGEDINLAWKPGRNLASVRIDPGQVDQLLANLCVNARGAIDHNGGNITIETGCASFDENYCSIHAGFVPGDFVTLTVSDDGCGMDAETLDNIFEPFFTTKGVGEGTGLGLSTVYGIVKQNNGFINAYSEKNFGTTFNIYLPALEGVQPAVSVERDVAAPPARGDETILLVEDEPAILDLTQTLLERLGYRVLSAATPEEAIRQAQQHTAHINLLITDVVMPGMNGRDLNTKLLTINPDLRSLFMSGYTANVIAHQGVLDEGVNFIQKPFTVKDLATMVRHALSEG